MKKCLIILTIGILFFTSCKKWEHQYPEDTEKTKVAPFERLTNKTWVLKNVTMNNVDITDSVNKIIGSLKLEFNTNTLTLGSYRPYTAYSTSDVEGKILSTWSFSKDLTQIGVGRFQSSVYYNTFTICHFENIINFKNGIGPTILRLEDNIFKVSVSNQVGDSTFTNTFYSN